MIATGIRKRTRTVGPAEPQRIRSLPVACIQVVKWCCMVEYGGKPLTIKREIQGELMCWWHTVVPEDMRHRGTDTLAAHTLLAARDPLRLVRWWIGSGDYEPWKMLRRHETAMSRYIRDALRHDPDATFLTPD